MPSPVDLRIWFLSKALGWPGRKIASEVGVSQPTVVRKLAEMEEDPPTGEDMQEIVSSTPPKGIPVLKARRTELLKARRTEVPMLMLAYTGAVIIIALAITLVLVALAVSILTH
jgi:AraC-like DNA-binding protein